MLMEDRGSLGVGGRSGLWACFTYLELSVAQYSAAGWAGWHEMIMYLPTLPHHIPHA